MKRPASHFFFALGLMVLLLLLTAGCQPAPAAMPVIETVIVTVVVEPTPIPVQATPELPPPDYFAITTAWENSPHGNTYDLGKGPNTYCSRCHSPQNWDPASTVDAPPNCVTCKFPTDSELRIATTMDFVSEEDWVGINCETCHQINNGTIQGIAWLSPLTREYQEVKTPNELCTKCHLKSQGVSYTGGRGVSHEIYLGGSAHKNWAGMLTNVRKPEYCTDCHDPHSQIAKQCADCHTINEAEHAAGKYMEMKGTVTCMACHEASGMQVGPHPDPAMGGAWVPIVTAVNRAGALTSTATVSHSIQWLVACDRCHAANNTYDLPVLTAAGEPVEEP